MDGERLTSWPVTGSGQVFSIAVAADGTHAILSVDGLRLFDRDGELLAESKFDALPACDVEFWGTDRVLVSHYGKDAILIFDRAATLVDQVKSLPGVPEPIFGPWTIATDPRGRLFLGDSSARAFVVQVPVEEFRPISTRSFSTEGMQHGVALDPRDRILVPAKVGFQVFRPDGTRLVARDPARDLTDRRFGKHPVAVTSGETLYVFAVDRRELLRVSW
jgi:hypothetical protein